MKPGDFYVSVTDLFAVLLPGAVCTFIGAEILGRLGLPHDHVVSHLVALEGPAGWLAFAAIAYIAGHFIASLGARLDELYDQRRSDHGDVDLRRHADGVRYRYTTSVRELMASDVKGAIGEEAARKNAEAARKEDARKAAVAAGTKPPKERRYRSRFAAFVDRVLVRSAWRSTSVNPNITNAYKLARVRLAMQAPSVHSEMLRMEADSKFFRSFVVVGVLALVTCIVQIGTDIWTLWQVYYWGNVKRMLLGFAYFGFVWMVLRLAFARFCELRLKTTELAFQGLIMLAHDPPTDAPQEPAETDDD